MKKYTKFLFLNLSGLLLLSVIIPSFVPTASFAQVTNDDVDPDGSSSECVSLSNNLRYRSRDANTNGEVSDLQDFLQAKGYLNSEPTGYFGLLTFKAVKDFQSAYGINPTGYVGPLTIVKIKDVSCGNVATEECPPGAVYSPTTGRYCLSVPTTTPTTTKYPSGCYSEKGFSIITGERCDGKDRSNNVVISGVSGPQTLNVGQTGTWTVSAYDKSGGNLSYSVVWGDEYTYMTNSTDSSMRKNASQQTATFTHSYQTTKTIFYPIFTVTNSNGQSATTSLSVVVGEVNTKVPTIISILPEGCTSYIGYNPVYGSTLCSVARTSANFGDTVYVYGSNFKSSAIFIDGGDNSASANLISSSLLSFVVPSISAGAHTIQVVNDAQVNQKPVLSNSVNLNFLAPTTQQPSITVLSPNGGERWVKGATQTIYWQTNKVATYKVFLVSNSSGGDTYTLGENVYSSSSNLQGSYGWEVGVGRVLDHYIVSDGSYKIKVCETGTSICDESDAPFSITSNNIGLVNPGPINVTVKQGESVKAFTLQSTTAGSFALYGYPTSYGPGINWSSSSGGMAKGGQTEIAIQINSNIPPGTYTGTGDLRTSDSGITGKINFPITVNVVSPVTSPFSIPWQPASPIQAGGGPNVAWNYKGNLTSFKIELIASGSTSGQILAASMNPASSCNLVGDTYQCVYSAIIPASQAAGNYYFKITENSSGASINTNEIVVNK